MPEILNIAKLYALYDDDSTLAEAEAIHALLTDSYAVMASASTQEDRDNIVSYINNHSLIKDKYIAKPMEEFYFGKDNITGSIIGRLPFLTDKSGTMSLAEQSEIRLKDKKNFYDIQVNNINTAVKESMGSYGNFVATMGGLDHPKELKEVSSLFWLLGLGNLDLPYSIHQEDKDVWMSEIETKPRHISTIRSFPEYGEMPLDWREEGHPDFGPLDLTPDKHEQKIWTQYYQYNWPWEYDIETEYISDELGKFATEIDIGKALPTLKEMDRLIKAAQKFVTETEYGQRNYNEIMQNLNAYIQKTNLIRGSLVELNQLSTSMKDDINTAYGK